MTEEAVAKDATELSTTEPDETDNSNTPQDQNEDPILNNPSAQNESDPPLEQNDDKNDDSNNEQESVSNHDQNETEKEYDDNELPATDTYENKEVNEEVNEMNEIHTNNEKDDVQNEDKILEEEDKQNENENLNEMDDINTNHETPTNDEKEEDQNEDKKMDEEDKQNENESETLNDAAEDEEDEENIQSEIEPKDTIEPKIGNDPDEDIITDNTNDIMDVNDIQDPQQNIANDINDESEGNEQVNDGTNGLEDEKDATDTELNESRDESANDAQNSDGNIVNDDTNDIVDENPLTKDEDGGIAEVNENHANEMNDVCAPGEFDIKNDAENDENATQNNINEPNDAVYDANDTIQSDVDAFDDKEAIPSAESLNETKPESNIPPNDDIAIENVVENEINTVVDNNDEADNSYINAADIDCVTPIDDEPQDTQNQSLFDDDEDKAYNETATNETDALVESIVIDEPDNKQPAMQHMNPQKVTKEIGIQTIIRATEIKLSSKTKKRIAHELGYVVEATRTTVVSQQKEPSSLSPIAAAKQMRSSSQKIAKIINEHKSELAVIFDRYSNGLTHKIKLDGLSRMLKDRNILKKLSAVPEITKAFHKSSFTKDTPESLTFDEFLQCIIRLANELLSRKKKAKYKTAESRVSLFLARLNLRPFPKCEDQCAPDANIKNNNAATKRIAQELSPNTRNPSTTQAPYDYRLTQKQLDSDFDHYFNTGGFFSDASSTHTPSITTSNTAEDQAQAHKIVASNNDLGPLSPPFKKPHQPQNNAENQRRNSRKQRNLNSNGPMPPNQANKQSRNRANKRVKPSPLQQKRVTKKKRTTSYQELYNHTTPQVQTETDSDRNNNLPSTNPVEYAHPNSINMAQYQTQSPVQHHAYHQPQAQTQLQPQVMNPNIMYQHQLQNYETYEVPQHQQYSDYYDPHSGYNNNGNNNGYNEEFERAERELTNQIHHLTEQEQQLVRNIHQRQQSQLNRAVQHRANRR